MEVDPVAANNGDTASFTVIRQSDLRVRKTSDAKPVATAGATHVFELEVVNVGVSAADNVVAVDTLPAGTTFHAPLTSGLCTETTPGTVTCTIGTLPPGATANLVVGVVIDADLADGSSLTNSVTVSGSDTDVDLAVAIAMVAERFGPTLLVEGGPTLNGQFAAADAFDEVCTTTGGLLVGGDGGRMLAHGPPHDAHRFTIDRVRAVDGLVFSRWLRTR